MALAKKLRILRQSANVSGVELARRTGIGQPRISRIECGRGTPSVDEVQLIAKALKAPAPVKEDLALHARSLHTSAHQYRRGGFITTQAEVEELEANSTHTRVFHTNILPGLVQTADYARAVLATVGYVTPEALHARLRRQAILLDPAKKFTFLLTEGAVRARYGGRATTKAQIEHLVTLATFPNVNVMVVPSSATLPSAVLHGFIAYDEKIVVVETLTTEVRITDTSDVQQYVNAFELMGTVALHGAEAANLIASLVGS